MAITEQERAALRELYLGSVPKGLQAYCHMTRLIAEALEKDKTIPYAMKERTMVNLGLTTQPWLDSHGFSREDINYARQAIERLAQTFNELSMLDKSSHHGDQFSPTNRSQVTR